MPPLPPHGRSEPASAQLEILNRRQKKKYFGRHDWRKYVEGKKNNNLWVNWTQLRQLLSLQRLTRHPSGDAPAPVCDPLVQMSRWPQQSGARCYLLVTTCQPQSTGNRLRKKKSQKGFQTSVYLRFLNGVPGSFRWRAVRRLHALQPQEHSQEYSQEYSQESKRSGSHPIRGSWSFHVVLNCFLFALLCIARLPGRLSALAKVAKRNNCWKKLQEPHQSHPQKNKQPTDSQTRVPGGKPYTRFWVWDHVGGF